MKTNLPVWDNLPRFVPSKKHRGKHIWGPFLPERSLILLYGAKGTAKSPFVKALCKAISEGKPFLGIKTRRRRVLYWDMENPPAVLEQQNRHMDLGLKQNKRFVMWTYFSMPDPKLYAEPNEMLENAASEIYRKTGRTLLIVLDHWQQFLKSDASGLEPGETKPLIHNLKRLLKLGATILVVGHPTAKKQKMYGFGEEDIDVSIPWVPQKSLYRMKIERSRHGETGELTIKPKIEFRKGKPIYRGFLLAKDGSVEIMREIIRTNPSANQRKLGELGSKALGIGQNKVIAFIKEHTGKEWVPIPGLRKKITYRLLSADGKLRFSRE
jgi:hypothetical protein